MESFKIRIEDDSGQKVFHPETEKDCVVGLQEDLTNINGEIDKLKTGGYADNLPIGSVIHVEQDSEIPAGYEEVLDDNYHVPANFVGSNEDNKLLDTKLTEIDNEIERINTQGVAVGDTLPIGGTFYFDGTEEELPTGFEKVDVIPPRQLLVNNDFQINQRGQSEYNTKTNEYTLDMWASVGVSKIRINPNKKVGGIYTNGSILQFVNENLDNQNVTLSMKIDGIVITKTFKCTVGYSNIVVYQGSKFQVSVSNNVLVDRGLTKFEFYLLNLQGEVLIEYIDLFEGDIAYPHVKEDKAIAMMRCRRYLIVERVYQTERISIRNLNYNYTVNFSTEMVGVPIITSNWTTLTNLDSPKIEANKISYTLVYTPKAQDIAFAGQLIFSAEPL